MQELSAELRAEYRAATTREIRSWSFGAVKRPRNAGPASLQEMRGTLDDERIFGPRRDYECGCGEYAGWQHQGMICDICGIRVDSSDIRGSRFGHIELAAAVSHPLDNDAEILSAAPILPALYFESTAGARLADLYDELIRANDAENMEEIASVLAQITRLLVPLLATARTWGFVQAETISRGAALVRRGE